MSKTVRAVRSGASKSVHLKRLDIQGLRAIAVLAVVADHLLGYPIGGFVGVDVFFVISGFLITSLLLREHAKTGTISFKAFYMRRIRRIMPVAVLVIVATVAISFAVYRMGRATSIMTDGLWALLFAGNWRFAIEGTDYWNADGATSPLQHYWSLGVEEQFYFVWPVVIAVVLAATSGLRRKSNGLRGLQVAIVLIIAGSFAWAIHETTTNAGFTYFSTFSRAWELGIGALLALSTIALKMIPDAARPFLAWAGIVGIAGSIVFVRGEYLFPAPMAALPVLSTALVIAAGTGGQQKFIAPLTNPVSSYIGDISYSLYLWHFPVIILMGELFPEKTWFDNVLLLAAMFAASALSYHFVEDPIRRSNWLDPSPSPKRGGPRSAADNRQVQYAALGALACAALVVSSLAMKPANTSAAVATPIVPTAPSAGLADTSASPAQAAVTAALEAALGSATWPELSPSIDDVLQDGRPDEEGAGCGATDVNDPTSCAFPGQGSKNAVVYGDSTAITLLPTIRTALGSEYSIRGLTMAGCITLNIAVKVEDAAKQAACDDFKKQSVSKMVQSKPDFIFVTNTSGSVYQLASGVTPQQGGPEIEQGTQALLEELRPSGARIVLVAAPPTGKPLSSCATRTSSPAECAYQPNPGHGVVATASKSAAEAAGSVFMDTLPWFCVGSNCPSFAGTVPVKRDGNHTTKQYAVQLAPVFNEALGSLMKSP